MLSLSVGIFGNRVGNLPADQMYQILQTVSPLRAMYSPSQGCQIGNTFWRQFISGIHHSCCIQKDGFAQCITRNVWAIYSVDLLEYLLPPRISSVWPNKKNNAQNVLHYTQFDHSCTKNVIVLQLYIVTDQYVYGFFLHYAYRLIPPCDPTRVVRSDACKGAYSLSPF